MIAESKAYNQLLVLRCQQGDAEAFRELVDAWQRPLWRHAYSLTGDADAAWDAVQEAWVGIVGGLDRLADPAAFPRWAHRIVHHKCADWIRSRRRQRELVASPAAETEPRASEPPRAGDLEETIRLALQRLPAELRVALSLHYANGCDIAEIAGILGLPEGTVKSRLHRARQQLRAIMGTEDE